MADQASAGVRRWERMSLLFWAAAWIGLSVAFALALLEARFLRAGAASQAGVAEHGLCIRAAAIRLQAAWAIPMIPSDLRTILVAEEDSFEGRPECLLIDSLPGGELSPEAAVADALTTVYPGWASGVHEAIDPHA